MKILHSITAIALVTCLAASTGAFAQQPTTSAPGPAMKAAPPAAATAAPMDKSAISKACSQQADAKGLKGKARKHFRSHCKHHGGAAE